MWKFNFQRELTTRSLVMKLHLSHPLSCLSVAAVLAFAPLAVSAQERPHDGRRDEGGKHMGDGMHGERHDERRRRMKGGDMMGGGMEHMQHMMSMMHEKLSHAGDRVASLKTELKITEAQMPAWTKFSDALLASAKSMEESMDAMQKRMQFGVHAHPSRETRPPRQMAAEHLTKSAGDQGRARSALCVVQRRTEKDSRTG